MEAKYEQAMDIIANGAVFVEGWHDDGDVESGPSGGTFVGYELHNATVFQGHAGMVFMDTDVTNTDNMPVCLHNSALIKYTGLGKMIADHLRALQENAERNGLEFVNTGRRPAFGRYRPGRHPRARGRIMTTVTMTWLCARGCGLGAGPA